MDMEFWVFAAPPPTTRFRCIKSKETRRYVLHKITRCSLPSSLNHKFDSRVYRIFFELMLLNTKPMYKLIPISQNESTNYKI